MKVEIYSDVVCPWCYVGERRFERALADFAGASDVEVVFRPFQLDPEAPTEAVPLAEYMERRYGPRAAGMHGPVDAAAEGEGIRMNWDGALLANTRTAHRLLRLAELEYGAEMQKALMARLFDLHFTRRGDIASAEQLTAEATAVGMDRERVQDYLASGEGAAELEADFADARALGVRAVPTFVFEGKWAVEGAQPIEQFRATLEQVALDARAAEKAGEADSDGCEDGACRV